MDNYNFNSHGGSQKQNKNNLFALIFIIAILLVGSGSFYGGMAYQKSKNSTSTTENQMANGDNMEAGYGQGGQTMGNRGTMGSVTAISSTSITVEDQMEGTSKTYTINSSTTVTDNNSTASVSDISTGDTVMVQTTSSNTSVATKIMLNPQMGGGRGMNNNSNSSSTNSSSSDI